MREEFEKLAVANGYLVKKITRPYYGEVYKIESTHHAWNGWKWAQEQQHKESENG